MKDWKQEIAEAIRARCDHGPGSVIVGPGCPRCQDLFVDIMQIMNTALDEFRSTLRLADSGNYAIERFKRSIPQG